ncbi:kinesin-like protein KIN-7J [Typha angustifolia]|uniref:kinesin-like protein KIN-7J n=1 Tax=Typha angustifolia TaxID=59011 RepID=UPI003C2E556D
MRGREEMGAAAGDEMAVEEKVEAAGGAGREERILVSVRLRPLNAKEIEKNDMSDWECIDATTVVFKNSLPERSMFPTAYTFDKVFGCDCTTRQVYEEGAKEVALSVVNGINSSVFAYGQTSSGKTYTMTGITEYSVADIYDYIQKHAEREFVLKFSAMEIYNEAVRDLLSSDATPLRLLDDPEKGTIVEKLTEETLRNQDHLKELLSMCEAQRQIGETSLNEMSSRSHQILRLIIESSGRQFSGKGSASTLAACVNFVDLAGSERASQALSAGMRLKEGCHINRSLLTLGTVVRKLSKGRNGHIPYRDSKLTRILQASLGGNARTAIICTMSPARSHIEQSRNTLLFASCAKEVSTNAQVNVVMSDKALVKHLRRELSRLEGELKYAGLATPCSHSDVLREKDSQIKKMEKELKELMQQRDLAQSRLEDLLRVVRDDHSSRDWDEFSQSSAYHVRNVSEDAFSISEASGAVYQDQDFLPAMFSASDVYNNCDKHHIELSEDTMKPHSTSPMGTFSSPRFSGAVPHQRQEAILQAACVDYEDHCKEVQCIEINDLSRSRSEDFNLLLAEESDSLLPLTDADKLEDQELQHSEGTDLLPEQERELESMTSTVDNLITPYPDESSPFYNDVEPYTDESSPVFNDVKPYTEESSPVFNDVLTYTDESSPTFTDVKPYMEESSQVSNDVKPYMDESSPLFTDVKPYTDESSRVSNDVKPCMDESSRVHNVAKTYYESLVSIRDTPNSRDSALTRSRSCRASLMLSSTCWCEDLEHADRTPPDNFFRDFPGRPEGVRRRLETENCDHQNGSFSPEGSQASEKFTLDEMVKTPDMSTIYEENNTDNSSFVGGHELVQNHYPRRLPDDQYSHHTTTEDFGVEKFLKDTCIAPALNSSRSPTQWPFEFEKKQQEIIDLWHACNVSLVHRSYFFLLFKGDPTDSIYMEVEHRRLSFLRNSFSGNLVKPAGVGEPNMVIASSLKNLRREREMLYRQMLKKLHSEERESLYTKWGIALKSKQRRLQLSHLVWTKTDIEHVRESATLVAKVVGLLESGLALREMFGLSFTLTPERTNRRSYSWKHGRSSLK